MLFFQSRDFRAICQSGIHQFLVRPPRLTQLPALVSSENRFPQEIEQQSIESFEPVLVAQIVAQQDILFQEKYIVLTGLDESQPVSQNFVGAGHFVAKQGFSRSRKAIFFNLKYYLKYVLSRLAENISAICLQLSQPRFHHVRLLRVIKMCSALANPFLSLQHQV